MTAAIRQSSLPSKLLGRYFIQSNAVERSAANPVIKCIYSTLRSNRIVHMFYLQIYNNTYVLFDASVFSISLSHFYPCAWFYRKIQEKTASGKIRKLFFIFKTTHKYSYCGRQNSCIPAAYSYKGHRRLLRASGRRRYPPPLHIRKQFYRPASRCTALCHTG